MTAHAMTDVRQRCLDEGMQDHISKPIEPQKLFDTMAHWLAHYHQRKSTPAAPVVHTQAPVDAQTYDFAKLTELDHAAGLHCMANKRDLYLKVLTRFRDSHRNVPAALVNLLLNGQYQEAEQLVHTLKGVAGSIGAKRVQIDAETLDAALKALHEQHQPSIDLVTAHAPLDRSLTALVKQLELLLPLGDGSIPTSKTGLDPLASAVLRRLKQLLGSSSRDASTYFESQRAVLKRILNESLLQELGGHLGKSEFAEALLVLGQQPIAGQVNKPLADITQRA
jgi:HPt (histidine-containing phosphotransfer) domain-containing protein